MRDFLKNTMLVIIIAGATITLCASIAYFGYKAYDVKDTEPGSYSRTVRNFWFLQADRWDERVIIAPDMDGRKLRELRANDSFTAGLNRTGYNFTSDWFTSKSPAWAVVLKDFAGKPNLQYLEIGVYEGRSVAWMFENILIHPTSHATGIDIFIGELSQANYDFVPESKEIYENNMIAAGGEGRFTTYVEFSQKILRNLPLNYYDIIYIDGDHMGKTVLEDAILSFRLLKIGGVLIFDDYRWFKTAPRVKRPGYAIDVFHEFFGSQFEMIHNQSQFILRKTKPDLADEGIGNLPESEIIHNQTQFIPRKS